MSIAYRYSKIDLGDNSGNLSAINDHGGAVGFEDKGGQIQAVTVSASGTVKNFSIDDSSRTFADGINDKGVIVGQDLLAAGGTTFEGFMYDKGRVTILDKPGATSTAAIGINNSGEVVGSFEDKNGNTHGFIYENKKYQTFDYAKRGQTYVDGVSNSGAILGEYRNASTDLSFVYENGKFTTIAVPGASATFANGISENGTVIGTYSDTRGTHEFIERNGNYKEINLPKNGADASLNGINNSRDVAGYVYGANSDSQRAIIGMPLKSPQASHHDLATTLFDAALAPSGGSNEHGTRVAQANSPTVVASDLFAHALGHR